MSEKKEYIERGAALETLKEVVYAELASDTDNNRANYIIGAIELIPAASVEPVVRCNACENWENETMVLEKCWCNKVLDRTESTFFCAHGRKR